MVSISNIYRYNMTIPSICGYYMSYKRNTEMEMEMEME